MLRRRHKERSSSLYGEGTNLQDSLSLDKKRNTNNLLCLTEEEELEELVFGRQPFSSSIDKEREDQSSCSEDEEEEEKSRKRSKVILGAWNDEDDDIIKVDLVTKDTELLCKTVNEKIVSGREYSSRLRENCQKVSHPPEWSINIPQKCTEEEEVLSEDDDEGRLLTGTSTLLASCVSLLPRDTIDIKHLKDANHQKPSPIAKDNARPVVPHFVNTHLQRIIDICWNADPSKRPKFDRIEPIMEKLNVSDF